MTTHLTRSYAQMEQLKEEKLVDSSLDLHFKELKCIELEDFDCSKYDTTADIKAFKISDNSYHNYMYQLDVEGRVKQDKLDWISNLVVMMNNK